MAKNTAATVMVSGPGRCNRESPTVPTIVAATTRPKAAASKSQCHGECEGQQIAEVGTGHVYARGPGQVPLTSVAQVPVLWPLKGMGSDDPSW